MNEKEAREIVFKLDRAQAMGFKGEATLEEHWAIRYLAGLEAERERVKPLVEAAIGLSHGTDWNNGTHAKLHDYRQKLLDWVAAYTTPQNDGQRDIGGTGGV